MTYPPQYPMGAAPFPPPAPPPTRSRFLLGIVTGVLAALIVAVVLYFAGALPTKDDSSGNSTASIALPGTVGSFVRFQDASLNRQARASKTVAYLTKVDQGTAVAMSSAYGGASAVQQTYTDQQLDSTFAIRAVRASSPEPYVAYQGTSYLGLARPPTEVRSYGAVRCVIANSPPTPAGQTPAASSILTQSCQRASDNLTVILTAGGAGELSNQPERCAALVDEVWDQLS